MHRRLLQRQTLLRRLLLPTRPLPVVSTLHLAVRTGSLQADPLHLHRLSLVVRETPILHPLHLQTPLRHLVDLDLHHRVQRRHCSTLVPLLQAPRLKELHPHFNLEHQQEEGQEWEEESDKEAWDKEGWDRMARLHDL